MILVSGKQFRSEKCLGDLAELYSIGAKIVPNPEDLLIYTLKLHNWPKNI